MSRTIRNNNTTREQHHLPLPQRPRWINSWCAEPNDPYRCPINMNTRWKFTLEQFHIWQECFAPSASLLLILLFIGCFSDMIFCFAFSPFLLLSVPIGFGCGRSSRLFCLYTLLSGTVVWNVSRTRSSGRPARKFFYQEFSPPPLPFNLSLQDTLEQFISPLPLLLENLTFSLYSPYFLLLMFDVFITCWN